MATTDNLSITQGKTYTKVVRWETAPIVYKAITAITQAGPAVVTSPTHGVPHGWRVAIESVKGMTQINAENSPPKDKDYVKATVLNANTIELNTVNSSGFKPYTSGGYVRYNTPHDLSGYTARMSIKDKIGGTELFSLTTLNNRIVINDTDKTITLTITAADTAALTWTKGVYDLELVSPDVTPVVTALLTGTVTVTKEVTTT